MIIQLSWIPFAATVFLVAGLGAGVVEADEIPVSDSGSLASVATGAEGGFVVVWQVVEAFFVTNIYGKRYHSDGTPAGDEFQINTTNVHSTQARPSIAMNADSEFVVVWTDSDNILGRRYASDGSPVGGQFQVSSGATRDPARPSVAMGADSEFVVLWASRGSGGTDSDGFGIQGQRYASDGAPLSTEFQVNTNTTGDQDDPSVTMNADGAFVAAWWSFAFSDKSSSIEAQRYASDGSPIGGQFEVTTYVTGYDFRPEVAMDADGDFVVVWEYRYVAYPLVESIQAQRFASNGSRQGGQFQVNSYTTGSQSNPSVAGDGAGDFVVVWMSDGSGSTDSDSFSIQAQRYTSDGSLAGSQFQVNTYTTSFQRDPSVAMDVDDAFVVAWQSHFSISARRFTIPLFADAFESGDTSAWSNTLPY